MYLLIGDVWVSQALDEVTFGWFRGREHLWVTKGLAGFSLKSNPGE